MGVYAGNVGVVGYSEVISMADTTSLALAKQGVARYRDFDAELMARHSEAMDSYRCEEFLDRGIQAYNHLKKADETLRNAAREKLQVPEELVAVLRTLYEQWNGPCARAKQMISDQEHRGFQLRNVPEFVAACRDVEDRLREFDAFGGIEDVFQGRGFTDEFWNAAAKFRRDCMA
jgi:hypothetical protein